MDIIIFIIILIQAILIVYHHAAMAISMITLIQQAISNAYQDAHPNITQLPSAQLVNHAILDVQYVLILLIIVHYVCYHII